MRDEQLLTEPQPFLVAGLIEEDNLGRRRAALIPIGTGLKLYEGTFVNVQYWARLAPEAIYQDVRERLKSGFVVDKPKSALVGERVDQRAFRKSIRIAAGAVAAARPVRDLQRVLALAGRAGPRDRPAPRARPHPDRDRVRGRARGGDPRRARRARGPPARVRRRLPDDGARHHHPRAQQADRPGRHPVGPGRGGASGRRARRAARRGRAALPRPPHGGDRGGARRLDRLQAGSDPLHPGADAGAVAGARCCWSTSRRRRRSATGRTTSSASWPRSRSGCR